MMSNDLHHNASLVVVLLQQHLAAWLAEPHAPLQDLPIEGERDWLPTGGNASGLPQALADLDERLGGQPPLLLVYDAISQALLEAALSQLLTQLKGRNWQILSYNKLAERLGSTPLDTLPPRDWIAQQQLPVLLAADDLNERQRLQEATRHQHDTLSERLQADRQRLEQENERLRQQSAALRSVDAERLITYLPALFPRVFSMLGGRDLALLTGRIEPFALPNPYPEPSQENLVVLQRRFKALPREMQVQVVGFIAELPQRQQLTPRYELRELVLELESEVFNGRS